MSKTIDERVVEMRFDNKQFENNVQTSLSTIEKLKKSLDMDGATKGLESIDSAAKKVDMSGLGSAVETVKTRFSALEIMAVTALANITNSVVNTGKQMLRSLTIEPISQGFEEYELKMGSIQTIMMSTGASLEEVNKYLQELNTYSDKTIYSFQDMTSNIGKFTNAGVGLEDAVMAIQGVSNVAAVSGANANEASRAMYNFAQALSAGYVKLIDWKSIENANIVSGCLTAIRNKFYEFNTVGQTTMTNLIAGIRTKNQLAKDAFVQIINSCLTAIRNKYTDFYNAGKYLVEGFAKGIDEYTWYAEARARAMARAAAQAAEAELDINSPSKVGYRIGGFFGMGFVNSLIDYTDKSYDAGASVAKSAKEGLRNAVSKIGDFIENGIDSQPTIRPLLDLSEVTEGAGRLSALLSRNQAMKISAGMEREGGSVVQNGGTTPTSGNNYNFTQNNYSPKALSRIDIYRQTKNQFSALKGLVET